MTDSFPLSDVKPVTLSDESEMAKELVRQRRRVAEMNAALPEGCIFHYEYVPRIDNIAVGEGAIGEVAIVDNNRPPGLMLVFNDLHSSRAPFNFDGRMLASSTKTAQLVSIARLEQNREQTTTCRGLVSKPDTHLNEIKVVCLFTPGKEIHMKAGDVHEFGSGVVVAVSVWAPKKQGRAFHIRITGAGGKGTITTVTDDPASERSHRHLFRQLKMLLSDHGRWPLESK